MRGGNQSFVMQLNLHIHQQVLKKGCEVQNELASLSIQDCSINIELPSQADSGSRNVKCEMIAAMVI